MTILQILNTEMTDNAIFTCTIANGFGMESSHCQITIEGKTQSIVRIPHV